MKTSGISYGLLREQAGNLPEKPGVYQFLDREDQVLYIGKAKNLKKRVSSYFSREPDGKTRVMIGKSTQIRHIVVESESDALLLENNLVKKYQPRYNIQLKDDKTFPWIVVKNERFPRIYSTRNVVHDGSEYFGPYTSAVMVRTLLSLIRELYPLRTCKYLLSEENITKGKYRPCLEYHLGNCLAPCAGLQGEEDYRQSVDQIRQILKGNIRAVMSFLNNKMNEMAAAYRFEEAARMKERIDLLKKFQSKSMVVSPRITNIEVYGISEDAQYAFVNYLKVFQGAIVQAHTMEMKKNLEESPGEILLTAITEMRQRTGSTTKELLVPFHPGMEIEGTVFRVPSRGDKKKLLELSSRNAAYYKMDRQKMREESQRRPPWQRILETVKKDLNLKDLPHHMECFDNSNIHGKHPVAACVVFKNARPSKQDYRHYNIKTVPGIDDFASMEEVVSRRYTRLLNEGKELPQLVIVDGGKGQLNAAVKSLEKTGLRGKITVIGIAKRLEEIYFPGDSVAVYLDKRSETLRLIQQMRNEAHRFGIEFHRLKRSGSFSRSELEKIKGIGGQSVKILYDSFHTWEGIKNAGFEAWEKLLGTKRAGALKTYFDQQP